VAVKDFGVFSTEPSDYPDIAVAAAMAVARGECERGVLLCGNGVGMCMTANKIPGIRAALCSDTYTARTARQHNNTNILCMGARVLGSELAREIMEVWLETDFSEQERHVRRLGKVEQVETQCRPSSRQGASLAELPAGQGGQAASAAPRRIPGRARAGCPRHDTTGGQAGRTL
jgi:ribose 5-phosphate isomerase B